MIEESRAQRERKLFREEAIAHRRDRYLSEQISLIGLPLLVSIIPVFLLMLIIFIYAAIEIGL